MDITLKNLKINAAMSDETICFSATVCVAGIHIAFAYNRGCGGQTEITPIAPAKENRQRLEAIEDYCKSLPAYVYNDPRGGSLSIPMDLELFVDQLVGKAQVEKDRAAFKKKLTRDCLKNVCVGIPNGDSYRVFKFKYPIIQLVAKTAEGDGIVNYAFKAALEEITGKLEEEEVILNTNIPQEYLPSKG